MGGIEEVSHNVRYDVFFQCEEVKLVHRFHLPARNYELVNGVQGVQAPGGLVCL